MAGSWLNALENLQGQFSGLPEVEKLFEKDFLWVDETFVLASGLFKKDTTQEDSENTNENEGPGTPLGVPPVLLPTTPGVKKDRAERLGNSRINASRRSSIRVVTGALAGKRTSRQASKNARQNISKAVDAMTNLGKKIRRPTNFGNNGTVSFATNGSTDSFEDETEEIEETKEETEEAPQMPEVKVTEEPEEETPMETDEQEEKTEDIVPKIQLEEEIVESPSKKAGLDLENEAENVEAQIEAETEIETNTSGVNEKNHDESFESCNELQLEDETEVLPTMNVVDKHIEQQTETNQEPSEKEDTETVDATDAANAGDKATDENL
jgi:hypothetical protein